MNANFTTIRELLRRFDPARYESVADLFLRFLGVIYYCAFTSLWTQVRGLAGDQGILPARQLIQSVGAQLGGFERWHQFPTFCWVASGDTSLMWQCGIGTLLSIFLIIGVAPRLTSVLLWLLWLSLTVACRDFLGFQWENLLLESGFLAIFLSPWAWSLRRREQPPLAVIWLFRWLVFRLMFLSGMVKLLSGDPAWRDLTALSYHYETQPLPTVFAWYAHHLPAAILMIQTGAMYVIELVFPFLIFLGRKARFAAFIGFVLLQLGIAITGNYCYFNFLSIVLCFLLLDDEWLRRMTPARWRKPPPPEPATAAAADRRRNARLDYVRAAGFALVATIVLLVSFFETLNSAAVIRGLPGPIYALNRWVAPFRSINTYGLFAVMTKTLPEIIIEGSNDGEHWLPYEFKYKPGDLKQRPQFVAPHQPRLDWQMWFAALGTYEQNPWFVNFTVALLQGNRAVTALLKENPFPDQPPRFIRASTYQYKFTDAETRRRTGQWWQREFKGLYLPVVSLERAKTAGL